MATDVTYYVGQGTVFMAPRVSGGAVSGGFLALGDCDHLSIEVNQKFDDIEESQSGNRLVAAHVPVGATYSFKMNLLQWSRQNLAKFLYGTDGGAVALGTVTGEAVKAYASSMTPLANPGVSAVVVHNGAASLVEGTDYTVDAANGTLTWLPGSTVVTSVASPVSLTVDYSYAAYSGKVEAVTATMPEIAIRFNGLNTANGGSPVIVTLHRAAINLAKTLDLLNNKHGSLEVDGMLLPDTTITTTGLSQFYNLIKV